MEQMTGKNSFITEGSSIVNGIIPSFSQYVPITISGFTFIGNIITIFVLKTVGRRILLVVGNGIICFILLIIGVLCIFDGWAPQGILVVVLLCIFLFLYGLSVGTIVWFYIP